jgi:acetolactate synthase small subunit
MKRMADIFRGRIIDVTDKTYTIELTGTGAKLDAFMDARLTPRPSWKRCAPVLRASAVATGS